MPIATPVQFPAVTPPEDLRVLCVDDALFVHQLYRSAFRRRGGVTSYEAHDGLEGLSLLDQHGPVHLAIVDVNMPVMDGLEFVQHLRRRPGHEHTYVLMATTEDLESRLPEALEGGPGGALRKPFTLEQFNERLDVALEDARARRAAR